MFALCQALADLNSDGLLDFNISFGSGQDATLLESRIDFDVVQRSAIPEPSLLALLGIGLLVMRQRRRRIH